MPSNAKSFRETPLSQSGFIALEPQSSDPKVDRFGLAISGGGIRSATFALGVMQALARLELLSKMDYLSTVSGGGYIGTWLSLWAQRDPAGLAGVEQKLVPPPESKVAPATSGEIVDELTWLRQYSNFLAPVTGVFSADSWLIFTIWVRNTILNLLVLIPLLSVVLLAPWVYLSYLDQSLFGNWSPSLLQVAAMVALMSSVLLYRQLQGFGLIRGVLPAGMVCLYSLLLTKAIRLVDMPIDVSALIPTAGGAALTGILCCYGMWTANRTHQFSFVVRCGLAAFVAASVISSVHWVGIQLHLAHHGSLIVEILGAPLISAACSLLLILMIGVLGPLTHDEDREGLSRVTAWIGILSSAGLVVNLISSYGPAVLGFLYQGGQYFYATGGLWAAISGYGAYRAQSSSSAGNEAKQEAGKVSLVDRLLPLTSYIFVFGLLFLVSFGVHLALGKIGGASNLPSVMGDELLWPGLWGRIEGAVSKDVEAIAKTLLPLQAFLTMLVVFLISSRFLPINEFSMFSFYKNRLVRAYCGASRKNRDAQPDFVPFSNLAANDDLPMALPAGATRPSFTHLINTAANISLEETGLAERRAVSFVFTPYGCGYRTPNGSTQDSFYRQYKPGQPSVTYGTAMTISGAAASPNMGYHTSPVLAFLMTVFNVRLGFWFWNPGKESTFWQKWEARIPAKMRPEMVWLPVGPKWGTFYFISELFALANKSRKYLYLSDGGHFENLAVYELLARRVKYILCIDGEEDPNLKFEGLGALVRKAQADFGIRIRIDTSDIEERTQNGWSRSHCTVGRIQYPDRVDHGYFIYIKLSVTGDESQDILTYRKLNPVFPHQSTADQFFNESQFESYRRLGYHVGNMSFLRQNWTAAKTPHPSVADFFQSMDRTWQPLPRAILESLAQSNERLDSLVKEMASTQDLRKLAGQLSGAPQPSDDIQITDAEYGISVLFCQRLIQFTESTYFELQLNSTLTLPAMQGWKGLFLRWFQSPLLSNVYKVHKDLYSTTFQVFCESHLLKKPQP